MTDIKTPKHHFILVPMDFSQSSENALTYAVKMAKLFDNEITLLNVVSGGMKSLFLNDGLKAVLRDSITTKMEKYKAQIQEAWPEAVVNLIAEDGKPYKVITKIASSDHCDQIVMGSNGHNGMEKFIGSTTSRVIKSSPVPVVAVKGHTKNPNIKTIVVPFDLTKTSKQKLYYAIQFAKKYDSVVHVIMEVEKDEFIKNKVEANLAYVKNTLTANGVKFVAKLLDDRAYPDHLGKDTVQYAGEVNADLIMIMTHDESNFSEIFMGGYAKQVVNSSGEVPVMCITPKKTFSYEGIAF